MSIDLRSNSLDNLTASSFLFEFLKKSISAHEYAKSIVDRINKYEKVLKAWVCFDLDDLLKNAKKIDNNIFTKSGLMVGLGENKDEIVQVMDDLRSAEVDFLTIGQYLQPSTKHHPLERYYKPEEFDELKTIAKSKGFLLVSSSPLTRSSYHADEDFAKLQHNRINNH